MDKEIQLMDSEPPSELEPPSEELEPPSSTSPAATMGNLALSALPAQPSLFSAPHLIENFKVRPLRAPASFKVGTRSRIFQLKYFPKATRDEWNDWRWQVRNRIKDIETLGRILDISDDERDAARSFGGNLPLNITPYYASLLDAGTRPTPYAGRSCR